MSVNRTESSIEDMKEEITSLAMTVQFLMDDVQYLLDNPTCTAPRKDQIKEYLGELKGFIETSRKHYGK